MAKDKIWMIFKDYVIWTIGYYTKLSVLNMDLQDFENYRERRRYIHNIYPLVLSYKLTRVEQHHPRTRI